MIAAREKFAHWAARDAIPVRDWEYEAYMQNIIKALPLCAAPDETECIFSYARPGKPASGYHNTMCRFVRIPAVPKGTRYCLNFALTGCRYFKENPEWKGEKHE